MEVTEHKANMSMTDSMDWSMTCQKCHEAWPCETEILRRRVKNLEATIRYDPENIEILINGERVIMSTRPVEDPLEKNWIQISLADDPRIYTMNRLVETAVKNWVIMRMSHAKIQNL